MGDDVKKELVVRAITMAITAGLLFGLSVFILPPLNVAALLFAGMAVGHLSSYLILIEHERKEARTP